MKKFIVTAVGVAVTVLFCLVMITVSGKGQSSINKSSEEFDDIISGLSNGKLDRFDNASIPGSEVIDLINDLDSSSGFNIIVINGANQASGASKTSTTYRYDAGESTLRSLRSAMKDSLDTYSYINPQASFDSTISRDNNDVITTVTFRQRQR